MADEIITTVPQVIAPSDFGKIDWKDVAKSAGTAAIATILVALYTWANDKHIPNGSELGELAMTAIAGFIGNIIRSVLTNSGGQLLKSEHQNTPAGSTPPVKEGE
jgi:hypothetical protein